MGVGEDCNTGYRDLSRNQTASWAWDMTRIASARPQCEGSRLGGVLAQEIGHMWRRPWRD